MAVYLGFYGSVKLFVFLSLSWRLSVILKTITQSFDNLVYMTFSNISAHRLVRLQSYATLCKVASACVSHLELHQENVTIKSRDCMCFFVKEEDSAITVADNGTIQATGATTTFVTTLFSPTNGWICSFFSVINSWKWRKQLYENKSWFYPFVVENIGPNVALSGPGYRETTDRTVTGTARPLSLRYGAFRVEW